MNRGPTIRRRSGLDHLLGEHLHADVCARSRMGARARVARRLGGREAGRGLVSRGAYLRKGAALRWAGFLEELVVHHYHSQKIIT
jgi:hypothetical protein